MYLPTYTPVWNWRGAKNENNRYPIHLRVTINRSTKYSEIKVPLKIKETEWSGKTPVWVKNTHPFAQEINLAIKEHIDILDDLTGRYFKAKKSLTFPLVLKELQQNNNTRSFLDYFREIIKDPPELLDGETMKRYRAALLHLEKFRPVVTFNDLSDELFQAFKKYCVKEANLKMSTINGYFNACKKVVNWARKAQHITREHEETMFEDVHITVGKPNPKSLEVEEISQWKNYDFQGKYAALERDRNIFLIQIYTGYYYNDLRELLKTEVKCDPEYGRYFKSDRYKNDHLALVPFFKFKNAWSLIERYISHDKKDPYFFRRDIFTEDQPYNRSLKRIAGHHLHWERNVYNKLGRQTNAQLWVRYGVGRPVVAKILGQEREESASHYYDVNIKDVIEGTKNVNFDQFDI